MHVTGKIQAKKAFRSSGSFAVAFIDPARSWGGMPSVRLSQTLPKCQVVDLEHLHSGYLICCILQCEPSQEPMITSTTLHKSIKYQHAFQQTLSHDSISSLPLGQIHSAWVSIGHNLPLLILSPTPLVNKISSTNSQEIMVHPTSMMTSGTQSYPLVQVPPSTH